jgi:DNA-binding NtrC family response regulator
VGSYKRGDPFRALARGVPPRRAMTSTPRVLVVDDDAAMREMLASLLEEDGLRVRTVASAREALERASEEEFDAVLSDIHMPGEDGRELLGALRALRPGTPVLLMTAFGSIDSAVESMRAGAFDYITKPFKRGAVLAALGRAFEHRRLEEENRRLRRALDQTSSFGDLMGASPQMREIFALIRKISASRSNVLITGESGTGKEVVARTIHFTGTRADKPFIPINCTAMPEGLLESELFGHVRGAFTGAHTTKKGLFEEAEGGTLFLDEIGDMAPGLQSKLLRVLQDREVRPVGGNRSVRVDVRIIAATNKSLKDEIDEGRFRQDLFYRLNVIPIHIPPLRERPEDIALLAEHFGRKHSADRPRRISEAAMARLRRMPWEGNARELENAIERSLALACGDEISADDLLPLEVAGARDKSFEDSLLRVAVDKRLTLRELGDRYVEGVLALTGGNKVQAARILGINRRTLYRRGEAEGSAGDAGHPE